MEFIPIPVEIMNTPAGISGWEIATAVGTILAAGVPALLWWFERRDRKAAENQLIEQRNLQEREVSEIQVRKVALWEEWWSQELDHRNIVACLVNYSDAPIFDIELLIYSPHREGSEEGQLIATSFLVNHLGPGERLEPLSFKLDPVAHMSGNYECVVSFRDLRGSRWTKFTGGKFHKSILEESYPQGESPA